MDEATTLRLMIILRIVIALIALIAAYLMYRFQTVAYGLRINAVVGLVNPILFMAISLLGIANMANKLVLNKLIGLLVGVLLILWGTT